MASTGRVTWLRRRKKRDRSERRNDVARTCEHHCPAAVDFARLGVDLLRMPR
jgi:hypothetical protein